ncbi:MAG: SDR family oxidoreductase [Bacteroidota bacterium]
MRNILVAGATGYLGSYIIEELQYEQLPFSAIARNDAKLRSMGLTTRQILKAEVTNPTSLQGLLEGVDVLISAVGITRQKDGLTYMDVDYQANSNLLKEAEKAGVKKIIYVSAIGGEQMRHLKIFAAKEKFVDELKASGIDYTIVRPNGFFSDMNDFLQMAKGGKVYLFGQGDYKLNPIHGADLAKAIVEAIPESKNELVIGGPDILTQNEIAELALRAWKRPIKIIHLPDWVRRGIIAVMRKLTPSKIYGPIEFFLSMLAQDNIAPRYGVHRLSSYFVREVDQLHENC